MPNAINVLGIICVNKVAGEERLMNRDKDVGYRGINDREFENNAGRVELIGGLLSGSIFEPGLVWYT